MAITPLHPKSVISRPDLGKLEDIAADLDASATFSLAAERFLNDVGEYLRMYDREKMTAVLELANHCETLMIEARVKAEAAKRNILAFHEGEFAARRSGEG